MMRPTVIPAYNVRTGIEHEIWLVRLLTGEDGNDSLVYCLYLFLLENITGEEGNNEKHDEDEESP